MADLTRNASQRCLLLVAALSLLSTGCWAPYRSYGVQARDLPDSFRLPERVFGDDLGLANLTVPPPPQFLLGPEDLLEVTVIDRANVEQVPPTQVRIQPDGTLHLPLIPPLSVARMSISQAQAAITKAYANQIFVQPRVRVAVVAVATVNVLVLGEVNEPGIKNLPRYQTDVGHAVAAAGGFTDLAGGAIEVHRHIQRSMVEHRSYAATMLTRYEDHPERPKSVMRIPLRGLPAGALVSQDVALGAGDVVVVPSRKNEVFWVVGELNDNNFVRFTLGNRDRELGTGLVLPPDREIDVVTAVVMAGYIDPINSPTTVTLQRTEPDGSRLLILVDLVEARYDPRASVLVRAGDIIYLNPDSQWWLRRTFDRIVPEALTIPYDHGLSRAFLGARQNN